MKFWLLFSFISFSLGLYAQDVVFSQHYASGTVLNPALAGTSQSANISLNSRSQWSSINSTYSTNRLAIIVPVKSHAFDDVPLLAIGMSFINDKVTNGDYNNTSAYLTLAYNVHLSDLSVLTFSGQGGFVDKRIEPTSYIWNSQYVPGVGVNTGELVDVGFLNDRTNYVDLSTGLLFNSTYSESDDSRGFFVGASVYHLNRPNHSFVKNNEQALAMRMNFHGGADIGLSEKITLQPNVLFVYQQEMQLNTGLYAKYHLSKEESSYKNITLGAWYRLQDSFILTVGYESNLFTAGLSYDLNTSSLNTFTNGVGAYEFYLNLQMPSKRRQRHHNPRL